jgi:uncharacterized protein (DUF488 family)
MSAVCTIGYEGAVLDQWVETLAAADVETVVDVRDIPISRRKGFSKTALAARLEQSGIGYVHARALGNPREWRHALKDGDMTFEEFAPLFREQLSERADELASVLEMARTQRVCLVCFEEDPAQCHRSLVAESLAAAAAPSMTVEHLRHASGA